MLQRFLAYVRLDQLELADLIDILIVWIIVYQLLLLVKGTRAVQMVQGGIVIALAFLLSRWFHLQALNQAVRYIIDYLPFVIIVIFQAEIRQLLMHLGRNPVFRWFASPSRMTFLEEIIHTVTTLSSRNMGALIVIERLTGMKNYMESGIQVDAVCSYDLLVNIFNPKTPLHDGAVIIREERIAAAACFLPLTLAPSLSKEYGSRHRAAIGVTEETDAVAVVVSEETGAISAAVNGKITRNLTAEGLKYWFDRVLVQESKAAKVPFGLSRRLADSKTQTDKRN
ncbi:diadenylate cyclase CdaA [Acidobacteriota bacterium]